MNCPEFEDLVNVAFAVATGRPVEGSAALCLEHVDSCSSCSEQVEGLVKVIYGVEGAMAAAAREEGGACLEDERIAAYFDGALEGGNREACEAHFVTCNGCFGRLLDLSEAMRHAVQEGVAPLQYVLRLAKRGMELVLHPDEGFAWVDRETVAVMGPGDRDEQRSWSWTQASGDFLIAFSATQLDESHVDLSLCVEHKPFPVEGVRLFLKSGDRLLQSELLSAQGTIELRQLECGSYELELVSPQGEALPLHFDIQ